MPNYMPLFRAGKTIGDLLGITIRIAILLAIYEYWGIWAAAVYSIGRELLLPPLRQWLHSLRAGMQICVCDCPCPKCRALGQAAIDRGWAS